MDAPHVDEPKRYVIVVWPSTDAPANDDAPDAYGPLGLSEALAAQESVRLANPDVGIEVALLRDVGKLFERFPLP